MYTVHMRYFFILIVFLTFFVPSTLFAVTQKEASLQDKIDQLFIIGFRGDTLETAPELSRALKETNIGGIILFDYDTPTKTYKRNITSFTQVQKLVSDAQTKAKTPLFVSIDEEGGLVSRLKTIPGYVRTPSAKILGAYSNERIWLVSSGLASTLKTLGFNMNFAPNLDVNVNPSSPAIGAVGRSFSHLQSVVSEKGITFMQGLATGGVIPVGKHFPGHGSAVADSHKGFTDITKTYKQYELVPFQRACSAGLPMVMVAHVFNATVDPVYPATLSSKHMQILKDIGCSQAVVVSDDMDMQAITTGFGRADSLVRAINAGVDVLVLSNNITTYNPESYFEARKSIYDAVKQGDISEERIDEAYQKIIGLKKTFMIL